jgi:hypothetical protein
MASGEALQSIDTGNQDVFDAPVVTAVAVLLSLQP